jgi:hypothetical protein
MNWKNELFWKCPECGTEVWPEDPEITQKRLKEAQAIDYSLVSLSHVDGTRAKGGGGSSGKSHKKSQKKSNFRRGFET